MFKRSAIGAAAVLVIAVTACSNAKSGSGSGSGSGGNPSADPFPLGRGVDLVSDQLNDANSQLNHGASFQERVRTLKAILGTEGEPFEKYGSKGHVFYAVTPKTAIAPYGCIALTVIDLRMRSEGPGITTISPAPHPRCGLPYVQDPEADFTGFGVSRTVVKLRSDAILSETPDHTAAGTTENVGSVREWLGIGGRTADAPISCWLRTSENRNVVRVALDRCGVTWPPPAALTSIVPAASAKPGASTILEGAECSGSGNGGACRIQLTLPRHATLRNDGNPDRLEHAVTLDGRDALITRTVFADSSDCRREGLITSARRHKPILTTVCINH